MSEDVYRTRWVSRRFLVGTQRDTEDNIWPTGRQVLIDLDRVESIAQDSPSGATVVMRDHQSDWQLVESLRELMAQIHDLYETEKETPPWE